MSETAAAMQKTMRPSPNPEHHANDTRTLFHNPWMVAESTAAPPSNSTQSAASSYRAALSGLRLPSISLQRVGTSDTRPHPPVKVVKPDWGNLANISEPNVKATWLGHAVRSPPVHSFSVVSRFANRP
jgi:hypothetical protein